MSINIKLNLIKWLVSLILKGEYILARKEFIITIARDVNDFPLSKIHTKITTLRLLRVDGSSLQEALKIYNEWNK